MKTFNILKPDMLENDSIVAYYLELLNKELGITLNENYYIENWIDFSKLVYELDLTCNNLSLEEIRSKRKQLLTTIKGYELFYGNKKAVAALYDIECNVESTLQKLSLLKKMIRQKYVYHTDRVYIKFLNEKEIDFNSPLCKIPLEEISVDICIMAHDKELNDPSYNMAFFNKLHFPDPNPICIGREIKLLTEEGIIKENNKVQRLIK